jgi:peptide/nickel transport system permease protein
MTWLSSAWPALRRSPSLIAGLICVAILLVVAFTGPYLWPYGPDAIDFGSAMQAPGLHHPFGTDNLGRDVLARVLDAARVDLQIAAICVALPFAIGSLIGAVSGYMGGVFDAIVMRIVDVVWAFPFYVLVIAIVGSLGPSIANMYLAFTIVVWISFARIVRGEVLVARQLDYIAATQVLGFSHARIVLRHLLPNVIMPALAFAMADVVLTILGVTSLGFLGLGIQPPQAEWGLMISEGRNFLFDAPWISLFPGLAIIYVGITFTLVSDGLDDLMRMKS